MDALSGRTIGQHIVKEKLGSGGMAEVYKALHPRLNTHRAIKVIRPEFSGSEDFQARFESEAQLVAGLRHPNIVQIHDFGVEDDLYYMVMEFVEGRDLKSLMDAEAIGTDRAIDVMIQVARGLQEAHRRGVLHRDLKPENIMVTPDGLAVLMDFGIARLVSADTRLTQTGMSIGTPQYMAPEQLLGASEVTAAADVYALGIVLYELLVGEQPFRANTPAAAMVKSINDPMPLPRARNAAIPEALENIILKAGAKGAEDRFADAGAFADALEGLRSRPAVPRSPPDDAQTEVHRARAPEATSAARLPLPVIVLGQVPLVLLAARYTGLVYFEGYPWLAVNCLWVAAMLVCVLRALPELSKRWKAALCALSVATFGSSSDALQELSFSGPTALQELAYVFAFLMSPTIVVSLCFAYAMVSLWPFSHWWVRGVALVQCGLLARVLMYL